MKLLYICWETYWSSMEKILSTLLKHLNMALKLILVSVCIAFSHCLSFIWAQENLDALLKSHGCVMHLLTVFWDFQHCTDKPTNASFKGISRVANLLLIAAEWICISQRGWHILRAKRAVKETVLTCLMQKLFYLFIYLKYGKYRHKALRNLVSQSNNSV